MRSACEALFRRNRVGCIVVESWNLTPQHPLFSQEAAMQSKAFAGRACVLLAFTLAVTPSVLSPQSRETPKLTPLILEDNEGERRVVRGWPGHPDPGETFILKVDPKNGGSSHLVFMTADIRRGGAIDPHRHPGADEILFLESGTARVHLGDTARVVHGGSTVFIP